MTSYGVGLFPQHAKLLAASAISPEVARQRNYQSVDTKTRLESIDIATTHRRVPGLLLPVYGPECVNGEASTWQYRPDDPRIDAKGKPVKYVTANRDVVMDVPVAVRPHIDNPDRPLWITEGIRKADSAVSHGLDCIDLLGVWMFKGMTAAWDHIQLKGRDILLCYDADVMVNPKVRKALHRFCGFLEYRGAVVKLVILPDVAGPSTGLDDYLAAGHAASELHNDGRVIWPADLGAYIDGKSKTEPYVPPQRRTLDETVDTFRRWLYLDDPASLYVVAATLVANRAPGDPVWTLLVCAPSTGKTEVLTACARLPWVLPVAKVTETALLSGTSAKERAADATGGVLRQLGDFGVMLVKDFTSVLAQNRDTRAEALAALREVYDGRWDRAVGSDGGRMLTWTGKAGLVGGVTPALDRYTQVVTALGDRFVLLRMPDADVDSFGRASLGHGDEHIMRTELADTLGGLVEHADVGAVSRAISDDERDQLIRLAAYTARARTPVDRDGYHREILYKPQVEGPGRLVKAYRRLLGGLEAIGCDPDTAWSLLARMAVDSVPAMRTDIIRELLRRDAPARTAEIAASLDVVKDTAQLHLEDLSLLKVAAYDRGDGDKAPYMWSATEWLRDHWPSTTDDLYHPPPTPPKGSDSETPNKGQNTHETQNVYATPYKSSVPGDAQPCADTTHSPRFIDGRWTCPDCKVAG
jgi:hypothetical protein